MSLRSAILKHAIPLISKTSFSRTTLAASLQSLPVDHPDYRDSPIEENVIDTLFGPSSSACRGLVHAWEDAGIDSMKTDNTLGSVLSRRLEWSAAVGEHLVEAHALLSSPSSTHSLPLPADVIAAVCSHLRLPPLYRLSKPLYPTPKAASQVLEATGDRLPFLSVDPLGSLAYAWRIADEAVHVVKPNAGQHGVMREPVGAGVEWYSMRCGLAMAYLSAEAHLLQPFPSSVESGVNPHLPAAINALNRNLRLYNDTKSAVSAVQNSGETAIGFFELATRSLAGVIRSRGL